MAGGEPSILPIVVGGLVGLSPGIRGSGGSLIAIPLLVYILGTSV